LWLCWKISGEARCLPARSSGESLITDHSS
jgi:hypothetical protein